MLQPTIGTYLSANQLDTITYYIYLPVQQPCGIVQISHGMCEGMFRYADFANFLASHGFIVCGNDHLGHGKSCSGQQKLGYFATANGWNCLWQDVQTLTRHMQKQYPGLPCFLLGHSMGSFIARAYLARLTDPLEGAILMGTSGPNPLVQLGIFLAKSAVKHKGAYHRSNLLQRLAFWNYNQTFRPNRTPYDWLSRDTEIVDAYAANPDCNFVFTASGFLDLFRLLASVSTPEWACSLPKQLPVLITSGQADPVGGYGKGVQKVYNSLRQAGLTDLQLKLYPEARHELLNEKNRQEIYDDLLKWLKKRL